MEYEMKKPKTADHYYHATAHKICSGEQSRHWGYTPVEFNKSTDRYKGIIALIEKAMTTAPNPIYIPQQAATAYFQQADRVQIAAL
jgi:hypothetical protein